MSSLMPLSNLKAAQLKHAAFLIGLPTTGTKTELEPLIRNRISNTPPLMAPPRVVSVDMGIKNLGICVVEAPHLADRKKSNRSAETKNGFKPLLRVLDWKKVDVLSLLSSHSQLQSRAAAKANSAHQDQHSSGRNVKSSQRISAEAFQPSNLCKAAVVLAQDLVHTYIPTHILIERQRFRSIGASAVQEWTLRVNMLESMLWASFETMRYLHDKASSNIAMKYFPTIHEVSPARVAKFWCMAPTTTGTAVPEGLFNKEWKGEPMSKETVSRTTRKIEKKDKIAVVRSWLSHDSPRELKESTVALEFTDETSAVADQFLVETKRGRTAGKLDDLADCLLQSVAWVRWEENRRRIRDMLHPLTT